MGCWKTAKAVFSALPLSKDRRGMPFWLPMPQGAFPWLMIGVRESAEKNRTNVMHFHEIFGKR